MRISRPEIDAVARLARLNLTGDEHELFARQLGDIIEYARQVADVPTADFEEPAAPGTPTALRDDTVTPSLDRSDVLGAAPQADPDTALITVPRVLG
jgi:aspartyl-tRNA(Asn)/glutamyl-tRNA(Gln) amidotransferase subunit C